MEGSRTAGRLEKIRQYQPGEKIKLFVPGYAQLW